MRKDLCIENDFAMQRELTNIEQHSIMTVRKIIQKENDQLRARVARLEEALLFVLGECDWEESANEGGGDNRIGPAIRSALEEK